MEMSRQRAALVVTGMPPGGKERVVTHLAVDLRALGFEPMIVCLMDVGEFGQACRQRGLRVEALESHGRRDWQAVLRLRKLLKAFGPDVVNVHDRASLPYAFLAGGFGRRRPLVLTCHGLLLNDGGQAPWPQRWAMRGIRVVTAVSDQAAREYASGLGWAGDVVAHSLGLLG